jgi:hypothetical protein
MDMGAFHVSICAYPDCLSQPTVFKLTPTPDPAASGPSFHCLWLSFCHFHREVT